MNATTAPSAAGHLPIAYQNASTGALLHIEGIHRKIVQLRNRATGARCLTSRRMLTLKTEQGQLTPLFS